jgi:hypothetical protein
VPGTELLINGSFETDSDVDKVPDNWKLTLGTDDKQKCDKPGKPVAYQGTCAFQFKGGIDEGSHLAQKVDLSALNAGVNLQFGIMSRGKGIVAASATVKVKIKYADGSKDGFSLDLPSGTFDYIYGSQSYSLTAVPLNAKVQIRFTSLTGKLWVDQVSLMIPGESGSVPLPVPSIGN